MAWKADRIVYDKERTVIMLHETLDRWDRLVGVERAHAHCDIPCGIYDPITAQIAALSVIRMIDLMHELAAQHTDRDVAFYNSMARYVAVKEEHATKCKEEIRIIWGDYMKAAQVESYPELHGLVHAIMQAASRAKQTADRQAALDLLNHVNRFAEIFWATKNVATKRAKAPYAPGEQVVYPAL
jgi:nickel superoxide dismutase